MPDTHPNAPVDLEAAKHPLRADDLEQEANRDPQRPASEADLSDDPDPAAAQQQAIERSLTRFPPG